MTKETKEQHIDVAIRAALAGGVEILKVYESEFAVEHKDDKSPLTMADKNAHLAIQALLETTGLPILSEEGRSIPYEERKQWSTFWMVDPLDGTKEFVKRNGEFTVNIALIENGVATAGIIYVPVKEVLYAGVVGEGAWKVTEEATSIPSWDACKNQGALLPQPSDEKAYTVVASRSHLSPETETLINQLKEKHGDVAVASMGSSLKICLVAEGAADLYPRYAPTMEWDTAAGHGIASAAGKSIMDFTTKAEMCYNKENLLNNWFEVK